ncbi:MAG: hypothetical protein ACI8ZN_002760 [Bacteroidia bacterium]|jgi:hypothetical protein
MLSEIKPARFHIFLSALAILLFVPFLGSVHLFDWDEINFAEAAREMIATGNYSFVQINYAPFWEKPPFFIWMQVASMKCFGINEFAARLPNALAGVATLNLLFYIGKNIHSQKLGFWWAILYLASFTPQFYFHSGIIDPLFNLFIFLSIYQLYLAFERSSSSKNMALAGLFCGLAVLTKGPVAALIIALIGFLVLLRKKGRLGLSGLHFLVFIVSSALVSSIWLVPNYLQSGPGFIKQFVSYQIDLMLHPVASHGQPWYYHPIVLLMGCFPASIWALQRLTTKASKGSEFSTWMRIMFWIVLVLFSLVTTKIVHYSSLCYFSITFLAAETLLYVVEGGKVPSWLHTIFASLLVFWCVLFAALPIFGMYSTTLAKWDLLSDFERLVEASLVSVSWSIWHVLLGLLFIPLAVWMHRVWKRKPKAVWKPLCAVAIYFTVYLWQTAPKVEEHLQGQIINFYESKADTIKYLEPYGYKSYAHLFYGEVEPYDSLDCLMIERRVLLKNAEALSLLDLTALERDTFEHREKNWLMLGGTDKPTYFICRRNKLAELKSNLELELVYSNGGYFVFYRKQEFY